MRITRIAVTVLALAAFGVAGGVPASAQPTSNPAPGPVTITLSPEQVTFFCERTAKVEKRVAKLTERINGGADVKGSTAWLKARAQKEREAGHETSAKLLEERAERRAGRVEALNKAKAWATEFHSKYCGGK